MNILSYCNQNKLAVCPQGGNTGFGGGCIPVFDEIIISAELLNNIISIDEFSGKNCEMKWELWQRNIFYPIFFIDNDLPTKLSWIITEYRVFQVYCSFMRK